MHLVHDLDDVRTFDGPNFSKSGIPIVNLLDENDEEMVMQGENSFGKNKTNYVTRIWNTKKE